MSGCGGVVTPTLESATSGNPDGASGAETSGAETDDAGGGSTDATTGGATGATSDAATDANGSSGNFGLVTIIENNPPGPFNASASFRTNVLLPAPPPSPCPLQMIDGCTLSTCPLPMAQASGTDGVSAGILTIRGGSSPLVLMPGQNGLYEGSETGTVPLDGGVLQVSTSGGVVPAFNVDVTIPEPITVTSPAALATPNLLSANGLVPVTIVRSQGWTVAWTGGAGTVEIIIQQTSSSASLVASCTFSPTAGSGVISPAVLAFFAPTDANGSPTTSVSASTYSDVTTTLPQNWDVDVAVLGSIGPSGPVVIQ